MMRAWVPRQRAASVAAAVVILAAAAATAACGTTSPSSTAAIGGTSSSTAPGQASTTACSTQGGGGDNIPVPCGPTGSSTGPDGISPPATISGAATPTSGCSDPTVSGISPVAGSEAGGDPVTITGTGFGLGLEVFFGGASSAYAFRSSTEVVALSPPGTPGPAAVTISCAGVTSSPSPAVDFTYQAVAASPAVGSPDAVPPSPARVAPSPSA